MSEHAMMLGTKMIQTPAEAVLSLSLKLSSVSFLKITGDVMFIILVKVIKFQRYNVYRVDII